MLKKKMNAYKNNSCVAKPRTVSDMQGTLTEYLLNE